MSAPPDPATALAHGGEARFIDQVVELGGGSIVCRGRVPTGSPAVADAAAGSWAVLELAAQAAALLPAAAEDGNGPEGGGPVGGYLVRIKNARFARATVPADTALVVRVERSGGAGPLSLFSARVELDGAEVARAELGTFRQD